jgi:dCTP diphosphatase
MSEIAYSFESLRDALRAFAAERDWDQFHSPKNLAVSLSVEAAELLQNFQWISDEQSKTLPRDVVVRVRDEMADVLLYLVRLADKLDVDVSEAAQTKMEVNALRYPVDKARGRSTKHTDL